MNAAGSDDYCTRYLHDLEEVGAAAWNGLLQGSGNPFLRFEFLHALQVTGCASPRTGWEPYHLTLWRRGQLLGAVPLYRKHHSYGEYVFDWAWAEAHQRHGIDYYPKWLAAVPFTPVPGPRLLAGSTEGRSGLAQALIDLSAQSDLSSLHVLFSNEDEAEMLRRLGALTRHSVQFHWFNPGYESFDDYLAQLAQPKRKKVRAERRKVAESGVTLRRRVGSEITESDLAHFFSCYRNTYAEHRSSPYLNAAFFERLARTMPGSLLLVVASSGGRDIAAALSLFDSERIYGRYWGALETIPLLHFEVSYYQLIEFAIERGLRVIEGGAQGEHKHARGFEPVKTFSSHVLRHPDFADAVQRYLERETGGIEAYIDELHERTALKRPRAPR
jgi:predicted N-acyltransferase